MKYPMKTTLTFLLGVLLIFGCERNTPVDPPPPPPPPTEPDFVVIPKQAVAVSKTESTPLFVYYRSWFQTPEYDAFWGIRWRMNTKDPNNVDADGKREIASYYYPTIGPYSSRDTVVVQLQSLWMKYAGIDGVSMDWFGTSGATDFDIIKGATEVAMSQFHNTGLTAHIAYQDKSIYHAMQLTQSTDTLSKLAADLNYLKQLATEDFWTKENNVPLLLINGPRFVKSEHTWDSAFTAANWHPETYVYQERSAALPGSGEFGWPWGGSGNHLVNLKNFYDTKPNLKKMGSVYPGFRDFYSAGGWGGGVSWTIGINSGNTLETLFDLVSDYDFPYVQIATWNDYNEGTMIEPTLEHGTTLLEKVQNYTGVPYDSTDLHRCLRWYEATLAAEDENEKRICRQIYYELISLDTQEADALFEALEE